MADLGPRFAAGVKNSLKIAPSMRARPTDRFLTSVGFSTACHVKVPEFILRFYSIPLLISMCFPGSHLAVKPKYIILLN